VKTTFLHENSKFKVKNSDNIGARVMNLPHMMWVMIRNITLKFKEDTL
jgi:hypothetical protein